LPLSTSIIFFLLLPRPSCSTLFPYTTLFRSPRFHHAFRLEALKKKITMLELLELYQTAYDEKVEQEKAEKRAEREGKRCKSCERSEEHTSELQSPYDLVCRLLLEKKNHKNKT